ncbi:hypothetical protein [Neobacillus rhizophilus]|uniref:Uncharacterized protein n=1 Tax=Neobacillus rhizophilus TaxID=2833579 RepID=A0A942U8V9_9BACI|nr:hypothetical protein [Neobacillus rhizophilus]MBS4214712.1 hypothetical protein [Neobacillus rhizophilus]
MKTANIKKLSLEIAEILGKSNANCRQIFRRAKKSMEFDPKKHLSILMAESTVKKVCTSPS